MTSQVITGYILIIMAVSLCSILVNLFHYVVIITIRGSRFLFEVLKQRILSGARNDEETQT